jgi:hypothetical protein
MNADPGQPTVTDTSRANVLTESKNLIFIENVKGLFLMNGGGAVALATWLQAVWEKEWATAMLWWQLWAMLMFAFGVFWAGVAYLARFLAFYHKNTECPLENPVWWLHVASVTVSIILFAVASILIVKGGFVALNERVIVTPPNIPAQPTPTVPPRAR